MELFYASRLYRIYELRCVGCINVHQGQGVIVNNSRKDSKSALFIFFYVIQHEGYFCTDGYHNPHIFFVGGGH